MSSRTSRRGRCSIAVATRGTSSGGAPFSLHQASTASGAVRSSASRSWYSATASARVPRVRPSARRQAASRSVAGTPPTTGEAAASLSLKGSGSGNGNGNGGPDWGRTLSGRRPDLVANLKLLRERYFFAAWSQWSGQSWINRRYDLSESIQRVLTSAEISTPTEPVHPMPFAMSSSDHLPTSPRGANRAVKCHSDSRSPTACQRARPSSTMSARVFGWSGVPRFTPPSSTAAAPAPCPCRAPPGTR